MERSKVVEIPDLPEECGITCASCQDEIEEAPYYLRIEDAEFLCAICKTAGGYKTA